MIRAPAVAVLFTAACARASTTDRPAPARERIDQRSARVDAAVRTLMHKYRLPAAGIAVIENRRIAWARVYGEQAPGVAATDATLFNVASLTKPITAEVILRLAALGKISLDEPLSRHWVDPDVAADPRHERLTPRIALSHQTGFPNWRTGRLAFGFTPGEGYGYSGEGYQYVGRFAEKKLGRTFESLAEEYVFRPSRLDGIAYSFRRWMAGRTALPRDGSGRFGESRVPAEGAWNGANNVSTTVRDYAAFMISVMKGEKLDARVAAERIRIHRRLDDQPPCRAVEPDHRCPTAHGMTLGWERFDYDDGPLYLHTGNNSWGESSIAYFRPTAGSGLVILTNGADLTKAYFDFFALLDPSSPLAAWPRP